MSPVLSAGSAGMVGTLTGGLGQLEKRDRRQQIGFSSFENVTIDPKTPQYSSSHSGGGTQLFQHLQSSSQKEQKKEKERKCWCFGGGG